MMLHYEIILYWSQEDQEFIAEVLELPGCAADGETYQEALQNVKIIMQEWIEIAQALGGWWITCLRFAPNAPQQNPVEDMWLQAKRLIRKFYFFCHFFTVVKALFELSIHCQIFDFSKLHEYNVFS